MPIGKTKRGKVYFNLAPIGQYVLFSSTNWNLFYLKYFLSALTCIKKMLSGELSTIFFNSSSYVEAYTHVDEVFEIMSDHWDFLEQLQLKADFEKLTEKQIVPMFKVPQIQRFSSYMLSDEISDKLKKLYLLEFYKFKEEKDSVAFQKLICKPENIKHVDSIELKESISQRLWDTNPSHKGQFTKFWNKEWAGKLLQEQTV